MAMVHVSGVICLSIAIGAAALALPVLPAVAQSARAKLEAVSERDRKAAKTISSVRARHGVGAVRADPMLAAAARAQADAMAKADALSHTIAGDFSTRMQAVGFRYGSSWENLGVGYANLDEAIAGWLASSGHRANLLSSSATRIGIASATRRAGTGVKTYWALILADDAKPPPTLGEAPSPFWFGSNARQ